MNRLLPDLGINERQLILNCGRRHLTDPVKQHTEALLRGPLSWEPILLFAELHGVAPLLRHHLKHFDGSDAVPDDARRTLLRISHRTAYQNQLFSRALHDILASFAQVRIPTMVLKGLSLVELIYQNLGLRHLIDLNLLIPPQHVEAARAALVRLGYDPLIPAPSKRFYHEAHSQLLLVRRTPFRVFVYLQWNVVNWPRIHGIDMHRFWGEARPVRLSGIETRIPSPEDLISYLCIQQEKYAYFNVPAVNAVDPGEFVFTEWTDNRLIRFTDIHEVVNAYHRIVDWTMLVQRAKTSGIGAPVYVGLSWSSKLFGTPIETEVLADLGPPSPSRPSAWMFKALAESFGDRPAGKGLKARFRAWWLNQPTMVQRHWVRKLQLLEFTFPRPDRLNTRDRSPKAIAWVGYLIHSGSCLFWCLLGVFPFLVRRITKLTSWAMTPIREASRS